MIDQQTEMIANMEGLSPEELLLIDICSAVNELLDPAFMPSMVKVGMGEMVNQ
jgi:hypothetical protein